MKRTYTVEEFKKIKKDKDTNEIKAIPRYRIIDKETGKVLDNAGGFGYRTADKAYKTYRYHMRCKKRAAKNKAQKNVSSASQIKKFFKDNKDFYETLKSMNTLLQKKGSQLDTKTVKTLLKTYKLNPACSASAILKSIAK